MQTELPNTPPTDPGNQLASPALPPVQRWIVLGMWMGLLLFGTVALWPVHDDDNQSWLVACLGVWLAQGCLPAVWAGLARQPLTVRLPRALGFMAVLALTSLWANSRSEDSFVFERVSPLYPAFFLVLLPPLSLIRWFPGWRIGLPEEPCLAARRTTQFSLRQLLIWTVSTAILLAWAKCVLPVERMSPEDWQGLVVGSLWIAVIVGGMHLPILISSVGLVLARTNRIRFALGTLAGAGLLASVSLYSSARRVPLRWREDGLPLLVVEGSFLGVLFGSLLVLRFCGYRLLRRKEERLESVSLAVARPCMWRTAFPYLMTVMLLIGLMLCWPAWKLERVRREIVLTRAWRAVGASPTFNAGEVASLSFDASSTTPVEGLQKLQELRAAPAFESLSFRTLTDDQMHYLRELKTLKALYLGDSPLTGAGLAQLDGLDDLQTLNLRNTRIADEGLKHLPPLGRLRDLDLRNTQITDEGLKCLSRLGSLETLYLDGVQITGVGFAQLTSLSQLKSLHLNKTQFTDEGLAHLGRISSLTRLELEDTRITDAGLVHLAGLRKLQILNLGNTSITDAGLVPLRSLESLEYLWLHGTQITDAGLVHLAHLKRLVSLTTGDRITDAGLKHLEQIKSLESLWLTDAPITDAGLVHLTSLQNLKDLSLLNTKVTDAGVKHFQSLENLESLWLEGTRITDAGLAQLHSLKKLCFLNPYNTQVTDRGIADFKRAVPACQVGRERISP